MNFRYFIDLIKALFKKRELSVREALSAHAINRPTFEIYNSVKQKD